MKERKRLAALLLAVLIAVMSIACGCGEDKEDEADNTPAPSEIDLIDIYPYDNNEEYAKLGEADEHLDFSGFMESSDSSVRFKALSDDVLVSLYPVTYYEDFLGYCRLESESAYSMTAEKGKVYEFDTYFPEFGFDWCIVAESKGLSAQWLITDYNPDGLQSLRLVGKAWEPQPITDESVETVLARAHAVAAYFSGDAVGYAEQYDSYWQVMAYAMDLIMPDYDEKGTLMLTEWIVDAYSDALFPDYGERPAIPSYIGSYDKGSDRPYVIDSAYSRDVETELVKVENDAKNGTAMLTVLLTTPGGDTSKYDVVLKQNAQQGDTPFEYGVASVASSSGEVLFGGADADSQTEPVNDPDADGVVFLPALDSKQTTRMGNLMNESYFVRDDDYNLCGRAFIGDTPGFVRNPYYMENSDVLLDECAPFSICYEDGVFYYIDAIDVDGESYPLCSYDTTSHESVLTVLLTDVDRYSIWDGVVYYVRKNDHKLRSYRLSDGHEEVVMSKEVYYPYAVNGWIVYQDDADGESLHAMRISDGVDKKLNNEQSYCPIIEDNTLWYASGPDECICEIDLASGRRTAHPELTTNMPNFYLTQSSLYFYEPYMDEAVPTYVPRENGVLVLDRMDLAPGYDNARSFCFAEPYYYAMVDYTLDFEYIEKYIGVHDYIDGDIETWLDISVG